MIKVENVNYTYSTGTQALRDINIDFPRGTISAVLGESGSGKTTLLMCLGQFLRPQEGTISYDGTDIYEIPERTFRKTVGIVFQELYLFPHKTVVENLSMAAVHVQAASKRDAMKEAVRILDRLGIRDLASSYPSQISGGQAQRAAIARALMLKPEYLLLDEPTSALDANTTEDFGRWLTSLREETNFIIVTHDTLFAEKTANHGVYLSDGEILDSGPVDKIIRNVRAGEVVK
ncbi:MAG: ATP-binding cassette domain-containing protein [Phycisphaerae bacterium]